MHLSKPVQLLYGRQHGEREPRARWLAAALGLALLGAGYALSLTTQPLTMEMMSLQQNPLSRFLWAVLLVIAGTYLLFLAGTVAGLKLMRANPRFTTTRRFSVVAGLIHRMRRNAVGLASICILSTMVLVMVSATVSLFSGREDLLSRRYARDAVITISSTALPPDIDAQAEPLLNGLRARTEGAADRLHPLPRAAAGPVRAGRAGRLGGSPARAARAGAHAV